jgi:hypothetical protein
LPSSTPRPLISDAIDLSAEVGLQAPIGALSFDNFKQLLHKRRLRISGDLDRIRAACALELEAFHKHRAWQRSMLGIAISTEVLDALYVVMTSRSSEGREMALHLELSPAILLAAVIQVVARSNLQYASAASFSVPFAREFRAQLSEQLMGARPKQLFKMLHFATPYEVLAALVLLQTHTGWNFSSMMGLTTSCVSREGATFQLQSFKDKTDDDTPVVFVDAAQPGVELAINVLQWNNLQIRQLGYSPAGEQSLSKVVTLGRRAEFFAPCRPLRKLIERHGLMQFSLDQIRTQVLFDANLRLGGIETARQIAGHASIASTGRYLDQIVAERLNTALTLEFARRLEGEVRYIARLTNEQRRDIKLLAAIGDGSSCADPMRPPPGISSSTAPCRAEECHVGTGCPNRRIVIDHARLREVIATRSYFRKHWQALWDMNAEKFRAYALPALVFNEALFRVLADGPFGAVLRAEALKSDEL